MPVLFDPATTTAPPELIAFVTDALKAASVSEASFVGAEAGMLLFQIDSHRFDLDNEEDAKAVTRAIIEALSAARASTEAGAAAGGMLDAYNRIGLL